MLDLARQHCVAALYAIWEDVVATIGRQSPDTAVDCIEQTFTVEDVALEYN